jgi:hypothetical protein
MAAQGPFFTVLPTLPPCHNLATDCHMRFLVLGPSSSGKAAGPAKRSGALSVYPGGGFNML